MRNERSYVRALLADINAADTEYLSDSEAVSGDSDEESSRSSRESQISASDPKSTENLEKTMTDNNANGRFTDSYGSVNSMENPGLILVSTLLTGTENYNPWSHAMKHALKAKRKLKFVLSDTQPDENSPEYERWDEINSLVYSWLTNSIAKDITQGFRYVKTAHEFWKELQQRFGENTGIQLFHLQQELSKISQGSLSISSYFLKLKCVWDEIAMLETHEDCNCGGSRKILQNTAEKHQVMQFLSGLNPDYEHVCNQILITEPMPSLNTAYSLIQRIEKQKGYNAENLVEIANAVSRGTDPRRKKQVKGSEKFCSHCKRPKHTKEECFILHGYPEWYKGKRTTKIPTSTALISHESPLDDDSDVEDSTSSHNSQINTQDIMKLVHQEVQRLIKGKVKVSEKSGSSSNDFTAFASCGKHHFSLSTTYCDSIGNVDWIVDSGASTHMCHNIEMLTHLKELPYKHTVTMPDGQITKVHMIGQVQLSADIILPDVLYIPEFTYNLLSVGKLLLDNSNLIVQFGTHKCVVQDLVSKTIKAEGIRQQGIYKLITTNKIPAAHHQCHLVKASLSEKDAFAFLKADEPGDFITYSAFCEGLRQVNLIGLPYGLSFQQTNDIWTQVDIDGNGIVDYEEFKQRIWNLTCPEEEENCVSSGEEEAEEGVRKESIGFSVKDAFLFPREAEKGMWPENYSLSDHARLTVVFSPVRLNNY